jgi:hypothetical protein
MAHTDPDYTLARLEQLWLLPPDATPIERVLLCEPECGPAHRHRAMIITKWGRSVGLHRYEP